MMNFKRILAFVLSVCMVLSLAPVATLAFAEENETAEAPVSQNLAVEELDGSDYDVSLTQENVETNELALEQEAVDESEMVKVLIVMEGESIIEEDSSAVVNEDTQAKMEELEENQAEVVAEIEETVLEGEALEITYNYTWLVNGVAAQVPYGSLADIAAVDGVKQVLLQPVYEVCETTESSEASPLTISDGVMVGRESTWGAGYTGEGIKIAIVDTGLDIDHQNFAALGEDVEVTATEDTVAAVLDSLNASARYEGLTVDDVYYSSKVAFGFNYCDDNLNITHDYDEMGDHGTHVAGIAAANKVDESGVVGVAPDAQLYIMKVFGEGGGAYTEDILAALEDALILGADVVNMSLGSAAGFTSTVDEINEIYNRVSETNTVLSVSAGNNYTAGYTNNWGTDQNLTSNPDNAVIGQPAVYNNVLSVASVENLAIERNYIQVSDGYQMGYVETSASYDLPAIMTLAGEYGLVAVPGFGEAADYEGLDVAGKVVLVSRGSISFPEKLTNASNAGAAACIVYNNASGEIYMDLTDTEGTIPCVSITMADGAYLLAALEEDPALTVSFPEELASIPSADAYEMSEFSSWGVAPDLSLEPDITAPGGNIYSTINNGEYGLMSGTSMASPNIAGLSALVMQYAKEHFAVEDYRTLVQDLLMSTSVPLPYGEDGLYYSPRSQGSGLANAYNAISTQAYLTVDGSDTPKAALGDDAAKTGSYAYEFTVNNFSDTAAYYDLSTVAQSEGVAAYDAYEDTYFMSSTPVALSAATTENSGSMVLTYDVDDTNDASSHDAYLIYQTAIGNGAEGWTDVAFRYDTNCDDAVTTDDVQAYLDALVGNESQADLTDTVLRVEAGETAEVSVSVTLAEDAKSYLDTYFENGGYVEGYTFLTARNAGGVDLSLPYLAFYGSWDDAPMIDDGDYWDLLNAAEDEVVGSQYTNVLFTNFYGYDSYFYPGVNAYVDEIVDPAHISVSPNGDGYIDTVDDIYTSLLRNAEALTYRYTNMETDEVYYEQTVAYVSKSVYSSSYGQIIPNVYSWYEGEIPLYDWKDADGNDLANNTKLLLEIEATGAYEGATPDTWSVPITVDLEAPELLSATRTVAEDGSVSLTLTFRDNLSVSVVALMDMDGENIYYMAPVEDVAEDENGYQNYTVTIDITEVTGKIMIVLGDYAMNEAYYGINAGGEGTPYGELVAYQYDFDSDVNGWAAFDPIGEDGIIDEVQITTDEMSIVCAEYVGGYVFAQKDNGALYGFKYEDMLKDTFDLETTYIAQLDYVYQDLAYSYAEGKLFGLLTYLDDGYPTFEINSINLKGAYYDEENWMDVAAYQEDWFANRGGVYGLTMAIDDAGTIYVLGLNYDWDTEELTEDAYLWVAQREVSSDDWGTYVDYYFQNMGSTGKSMDYLQSMTWDHNAEKLYWARFDAEGWNTVSELYEITLSDESGVLVEKLGELSGETCGLFAPLSEESAAKEEHQNLPEMDPSVVGTPILRDSVITMNVTASKKLTYDLDPWYTDYKDVVWSSSDESVVAVDENGTIYCVGTGSATVTVANAADESKYDTVTVEVTALDLKLEGVISAQEAGLGNATGTSTYAFEMVDGIAQFGTVNEITASEELNYGLSLATSAYGRGSIWACEWGNTGMVYQINAETGEVEDVLQPVDGDMMFGLTYSEGQDTFTGIMNMYLYVDLALTDEETDLILDSYDDELKMYNYHRVNMLDYLIESNTGFVTGEDGQGASSEIVFCGITTIEGGEEQYMYTDFMGGYGPEITYTPTQTLVILDNVGRLWFIDEVKGMSVVTDDYGNTTYTSADGMSTISPEFHGVEVVEDANGTYSVFVIREIAETPLTDMFREESMPRITYHFSDIEFAGYTVDGAPMIAMSLYDYWNNGTTNELYLYVPGIGTGEYEWDANWNRVEIKTPDRLYALGNTGEHNIIASVHSAVVTGGVDPETNEETPVDTIQTEEEYVEELGVNTLAVNVYTETE